jgi:NAD(P)-dependent dehydrogenase (short-subunit alcohol dehydrogenase family)
MARATASTLSAEGHELIQWSRDSEEGFVQVEDYSAESLPELPERLDGLVYFPGTVTLKQFHRIDMDTFREEWHINVGGFIRTVQHALPALQKSDDGSVVGISSVAVQTGLSLHASVGQAKGALEGLIRSLAAEYAGKGLRFNGVAPSLTETPATERFTDSDEKKERMEKRHPLGRIGTPHDMANAVSFLLTESSSWMTGQILGIDGGYGDLRS